LIAVTRTRAVVLTLVLLTIGLAGVACRAPDKAARDNNRPKVAVAPMALPKPTGPVLDNAAAARRYLEIVDEYNAAMTVLWQAQDAGKPWQEEQEAVRLVAEASDAETMALAGTAWPAHVQSHVDRFVTVKGENRQAMADAVNAGSEREYSYAFVLAFDTDECVEANAVRSALGLETIEGCTTTG
jgi:hypothetical protein